MIATLINLLALNNNDMPKGLKIYTISEVIIA